jgi:hypothetical protein
MRCEAGLALQPTPTDRRIEFALFRKPLWSVGWHLMQIIYWQST